jgi:hypothetical protein
MDEHGSGFLPDKLNSKNQSVLGHIVFKQVRMVSLPFIE